MQSDHRPDPTQPETPAGRIVMLVATLLLLTALTYFTVNVSPPELTMGYLAMLTGFVLLVANVAGSLAIKSGLPRLTGFVLAGMVAGPSVLGVLSPEAVEQLRLIDEFALALIAMLAGGELKLEALRPRAKTIVFVTVAVTTVVWAGMALAVLLISPLLPFMSGLSLSAKVVVALILGVWAANSSPDLTVAVIEETDSKGKLTDIILGSTIVKDVLVIVLITLTIAVLAPIVSGTGEGLTRQVFFDLAREVGGAIVVGALAGWIYSMYLGAGQDDRPPLATFLFAYAMVVLAERIHIELLITAVSAGFVIENLSPAGDRMIRGVERVSVVLFAFFFTLAGSSLDLAAVRSVWLAALLFFGFRVLFTWAGSYLGTRMARDTALVRKRTWQGLVSQGGVTLGLLLLAVQGLPSLGPELMNLGMAVILGGILFGPILLKRALAEESALAPETAPAGAAPNGEGGVEEKG